MWDSGATLNAPKEKGPPTDITAMWKFELIPDKQTLTMTINHYEPVADDETIMFTRKRDKGFNEIFREHIAFGQKNMVFFETCVSYGSTNIF